MGKTAGEAWSLAAGDFAAWGACDLAEKYAKGLDLLASKVANHLWDSDGGLWIPHAGDKQTRALSLAWLARCLIEECEGVAKPISARKIPRPRMSADERKALAGSARKTARLLRMGGADLARSMAVTMPWILPAPASWPSLPDSLSAAQRQLAEWSRSQSPVPGKTLADALDALAVTLSAIDRRKSRRVGEGKDTTLAAEIVTLLRAATGAAADDQRGGPIPKGGRPHYEVAEAFLHAALPSFTATTAEEIKRRLEARERA